MAMAVFGCVFGILGIFTIGFVFVPLAALCTLGGFIEGSSKGSASILFFALINASLTVFGFVTSPVLWLVSAALFGGGASASAQNKPHETTTRICKDPFQFCEQMNNCPVGHVHQEC